MKTHNLLLIIFLIVLISCKVDDDSNETRLILSEIPTEILAYKELHFPESDIIRAIKEVEYYGTTYELYLVGPFELDFNGNFEVVEIEGEKGLPDSVIPDIIIEYVSQHYPNNFIREWQLDRDYQKIELNNGMEIQFELNGDFIKVED